MTDQPTDEASVEEWIYAGRRVSDGKLAPMFLAPAPAGGRERCVFPKATHRPVGAILRVTNVTRDDDGSVKSARLAGAEYLGLHDDTAERADWEARDRAAYVADQARKREAKDKRDNQAFGSLTLNEVRELSWNVPATQRSALLAQVLKHIGV